jgi:hypothetical protein
MDAQSTYDGDMAMQQAWLCEPALGTDTLTPRTSQPTQMQQLLQVIIIPCYCCCCTTDPSLLPCLDHCRHHNTHTPSLSLQLLQATLPTRIRRMLNTLGSCLQPWH